MASSVGNSMVGGTVADLFHAEDRGLAMNIFALMVFVGQVSWVETKYRSTRVHCSLCLVPWGGGLRLDRDVSRHSVVLWGEFAFSSGARLAFWLTHLQVQAILAGVSILLNILVLRETRGDVLLSRRAKRLTKETGVKHMCAAELQKKSFKTLFTITAIRPFRTSSPRRGLVCQSYDC